MPSLPVPPGVQGMGGLPRATLERRGARWLSPLLALVVTSLTSPTLLVTGALLARDARSDHPAFWAGLVALVPLGNLMAALAVNAVHARHPFTSRLQVVAVYAMASLFAGGIGFTWLGWETGFMADVLLSARTAAGLPGLAVLLASLGMTAAFSVLSFAHAGVLHAWLVFSTRLPAAAASRLS
ncbi:MAG: hypothetical protein EOP81_01555 [Variovorax sp.]|nr:MAG: hypothetical protein EOP81_01555 [Variovorax sp.]